jgi:hypothetical protein
MHCQNSKANILENNGNARSWNVMFFRDFNDWKLEYDDSFLYTLYSDIPRKRALAKLGGS